MEAFSNLMQAGEKGKADKRGFTEYVLKDEYHATDNNCVTSCLLGIETGAPDLAKALSDAKESKGRGLNWYEKMGAGGAIGSKIFMPQDLQVNIEKEKGFYRRQEFKTGGPGPADNKTE